MLKSNVDKVKNAQEKKLRLGFVPLTDCAPLVMAQELGLFRKYNLNVSLQRELGWATVRDKIIYGELDAAHALAAMPLAAALGLGSVPCECITALVMSLEGDGITISRELHETCFAKRIPLADEIKRLRREKTFTFGVVATFSSHRHLLRKWLSSNGVDADRDVRIVVVPPPQMVANLKAQNLDGFCAGEPWNSVAAATKAGVFLTNSAELDTGHPEKVLMARRDFAEQRSDEYIALVAALIESCEWCAKRENHPKLIDILARPEYVGVAAESLRRGVEELCVFPDRNDAEPSAERAAWTYELMRASGLCRETPALNLSLAKNVFRVDLYDRALQLLSNQSNPNNANSEPALK